MTPFQSDSADELRQSPISTFMATIKKVYRAHNIVKLFSIFKLLLKIVSAIESVCEFWQMFF